MGRGCIFPQVQWLIGLKLLMELPDKNEEKNSSKERPTFGKRGLVKEKLLFLTKFGVDDKFILSCRNPFEDFHK